MWCWAVYQGSDFINWSLIISTPQTQVDKGRDHQVQYLPSIVISWKIYYRQWDWSFNKLLKTKQAVCVGVCFCLYQYPPPPGTCALFSCQNPTLIWAFKNGRKLRFSEAKSATAGLKTLLVVSLKHGNEMPGLQSLIYVLKRSWGSHTSCKSCPLAGEGWVGSGLRSQTRWWAQCEKNASFASSQMAIANLSRKQRKFIWGDLMEEGKVEAH